MASSPTNFVSPMSCLGNGNLYSNNSKQFGQWVRVLSSQAEGQGIKSEFFTACNFRYMLLL